nr:hypothetical protein CFP56_47816 [Quercus suber]
MNQTNGRLFGEFFCKLEVLRLYGRDDKLIAVPSVFVEGLRYLKSPSVTNLFFDNEGQYAGTVEHLTELHLYKMPKLMLLWKENFEQGPLWQLQSYMKEDTRTWGGWLGDSIAREMKISLK